MTWPWLALAGLGAFHGVNPAMGWLFAVALGLHRSSRTVVLTSLIPIALGHGFAIAVVAVAVFALGLAIDQQAIRRIAGVVLIGWAIYHARYGSRHRVRVGLRTGMAGLFVWSFLMASAHGAGLMLVPILTLQLVPGSTGHHHAMSGLTVVASVAAVGVHTLAMLATTGLIAIVVYEWVGLGFLRRGWVNLDRLWTASLVATGAILILLVPGGG